MEGFAPTQDVFGSPSIKPNIGACIALKAAQAGYIVSIAARTEAKLFQVRDSILKRLPEANITHHKLDLAEPERVRKLAEELPSEAEVDLVQCAGSSAGSFTVKDDNLFFKVEDTPLDLPSVEFDAAVKSLLILVQSFLPRLRKQRSSRIVVLTSMSGIRAIPYGFSHCAAKAGVHQAVRSLSLELNPFGIRVCEVAPGIMDTGYYDTPSVDCAVRSMGPTFGYHYGPGELPKADPMAAAEAAVLCLTSNAHILSVNLVADGQFPHHAS
jgi:NAD(P)-dependent dehydrogenase (short-subunit alcohol dehydrogenase family)